jgi:succinate dehydrogenase/fumarate reductase flavoprotein subunit
MMKRIKFVDQVIDTDVLVIGGGIAGCCAAIKAKRCARH